jgi:Tol biopolymer transport system component
MTPNSKLGPYEILSSLGKGGMGEVWRARDPRLNREVAIKVSAMQFTDRFEREAHAIASLNHPNICTLFDIGPNYLVMELIEGPTLAERIAEGPIPLEETLALAKQIADALEAAHEKGIVHRDLKPGNIKIRPDGSVKVLDFGLAKAGAGESVVSSESPTMLHSPTQIGVILGTAAYMAPEQARGKTVDKRADIWSFGVVLHEMLTGKKLFEGEDLADTLASVVKSDPDLTPVPHKLRRLLAKCVQKDPKKRLRDIGDWADYIESESQPPSVSLLSPFAMAGWVVAGVLAVAAGLVSFMHFREKAPEIPVVRAAILPPAKGDFQSLDPDLALSPDGRRLVFLASSGDKVVRLYVRSLDSPDAQPLGGTEGAQYPFWSPDSQFVGFAAGGKLRKVAASGGPVVALADAPFFRGATWNADGTIVFEPSASGPLKQIAASGGGEATVTSLDSTPGSTTHRWPWFLPDGRHFLYMAMALAGNEGGIRVGSLNASDRAGVAAKVLGKAASQAAFSRGYLLFLREQTLMAQPLDTSNLTVTGEAVSVAGHIATRAGTLIPRFAVSDEFLAYQTGEVTSYSLVWFDRAGKRTATASDPGSIFRMHLSPDRKVVAASVTAAGNQDIWLYDLVRGLRTRFTSDPSSEVEAVWSPDGKTIVFDSSRKGHYDLYRKAANGTGGEELLYADNVDKYPGSWSPDGKYLLYSSSGPNDGAIYALPLAEAGKPFPFLKTEFIEIFPQFSPDGRWVAYSSTASGRYEVYVTPFPGPGPQRQVSLTGGVEPRWRADGRELFYVRLDGTLMAAGINLKDDAKVDTARALFAGVPNLAGFQYDVSADGQHFLVVAPPEKTGPSEPLTLVQNWTAGLKK